MNTACNQLIYKTWVYSYKEMPNKDWLSNLWKAVHQEHKIKIQFNLHQIFYITIEYFNTFYNSLHIFTLPVLYNYTINSIMYFEFDNDDMESLKNIVLFSYHLHLF